MITVIKMKGYELSKKDEEIIESLERAIEKEKVTAAWRYLQLGIERRIIPEEYYEDVIERINEIISRYR